ncbi:MAG: BamA/TamA family outer membrane protein [Candidatus Wallbacteria bacterium]
MKNIHFMVIILILFFTLADAVYADSKKSGDNPKVIQIIVDGNQKISESVILLSLSIKAGDRLNKTIIDENIKRIYDIGYFRPDVTSRVINVESGAKVIFNVSENPAVKNIVIKGNTIFDEAKIISSIQTKKGNVFNHSLISYDVRSIQKLFDEAGFVMNRVRDVSFDSDVLTFFIEENVIEKIKVVGNEHTRSNVIFREIKFREGEIYNDKKVSKSLQKIFNLGYFSEVRPRCEAGSAPGKIEFIIELKEQKTGVYNFFGGYSSVNGFSGGVGVTEKNFRGKGQYANANVEFGGRKAYELEFTEPKFKGKDYSLGGNVYNSSQTQKLYRNNLDAVNYEERRKGFSIFSTKHFSDVLSGTLSFKDENVKLADSDGIKKIINDLYIKEGHYQTLSSVIAKDTRNNVFEPSSGIFHSANIDSTGGFLKGPDSFVKYGFTLRKYHSLNKNEVLAGRFTAKALSISSGTLPIYEEYGAGGVNSLRGFEFREFTGNKMLLANVELRHKVNKNFNAHIFYDMGDAWGSSNSPNSSGFKLKSGYGAGIVIITPIAPVRFDFAKGDDRSSKQYFSMDRMF